MAEIGLEEAILVWPSGRSQRLGGFALYQGKRIIDSLLEQCAPSGAVVYVNEAARLLDIPVRLH